MENFIEIQVCDDCGEITEEKGIGTEGWTICPGCGNVEGDTTTMWECKNCEKRYPDEEGDLKCCNQIN